MLELQFLITPDLCKKNSRAAQSMRVKNSISTEGSQINIGLPRIQSNKKQTKSKIYKKINSRCNWHPRKSSQPEKKQPDSNTNLAMSWANVYTALNLIASTNYADFVGVYQES